MDNLNILSERIIARYGKRPRIVVIGNAGADEFTERQIKNADCVVRFNNYATRSGITHTADKFRCEILFSTFDLHSQGAEPKDVVIGIPFPFKATEIADKPARWYPKARPWMVNPYTNMQMCQELHIESLGYAHPCPSIGFTALWHMRNWNAEFYISGFEWYWSNETKLFQNWNLKNRNYPKTWNHNYPKEIEWIVNNLLPKNNIIFSAKCMELLSYAKRQLA